MKIGLTGANIGRTPFSFVQRTNESAPQDANQDALDAEAMRRGRAEEVIPMHMADRLLNENATKVWRTYRGLTTANLAAMAHISEEKLSAIESGESNGSAAVLPRIAKALNVEVDDLLPAR